MSKIKFQKYLFRTKKMMHFNTKFENPNSKNPL